MTKWLGQERKGMDMVFRDLDRSQYKAAFVNFMRTSTSTIRPYFGGGFRC